MRTFSNLYSGKHRLCRSPGGLPGMGIFLEPQGLIAPGSNLGSS
jgi:hypothetical protein